MTFNKPDERNLGGRVEIQSRLKNHHQALVQAKPTINTHVKPKNHVGQQHQKVYNEKGEVIHAFKKIFSVNNFLKRQNLLQIIKINKINTEKCFKRKIQSKKFLQIPCTIQIQNAKDKKQQIFVQNIFIQEGGYDRSKNNNDPVTHPTYHFKTIDHIKDKQEFFNQTLGKKKIETFYKQKQQRPQSAKPQQKISDIQKAELTIKQIEERKQLLLMKKIYSEIPKIKDDSEKELLYLKDKLIEVLNFDQDNNSKQNSQK